MRVLVGVAPPLTPGRWHVVQRWRGLASGRVVAGSSGHTYLVHGSGVVVQSSVARGLRVDRGSWVGSAGLTGFEVEVLTLPEGAG